MTPHRQEQNDVSTAAWPLLGWDTGIVLTFTTAPNSSAPQGLAKGTVLAIQCQVALTGQSCQYNDQLTLGSDVLRHLE